MKKIISPGFMAAMTIEKSMHRTPRNLFKRKGKPKINLTKRVKKDDLTPLQTFTHVLTQGGNLRLNLSWHL